MLHVSEKTVRRRIHEFDMRIYSTLSDAELDALTIEFVASGPSSGQVTYDGFLLVFSVIVYEVVYSGLILEEFKVGFGKSFTVENIVSPCLIVFGTSTAIRN